MGEKPRIFSREPVGRPCMYPEIEKNNRARSICFWSNSKIFIQKMQFLYKIEPKTIKNTVPGVSPEA